MFCVKHQHMYIKVCSECVIEDHKQGVQSQNGDMFHYSSYWGTWSRVLRTSSGGGDDTVEVDLTAVNLQWPRVLACNVRSHRTMCARNDILCRSLPAHVVDLMHKRMSMETFDQLVHADLLSLIDWDKYNKVCNGGAALIKIMK
jgi:hypothetical protein